MRAKLKTALRDMSASETIAITVTATAGEWCTARQLKALESDLVVSTNYPASKLKTWQQWVKSWEEAGWLEIAKDRYDTLHYRLPHDLRHVVLESSKKVLLEAFYDELDENYWKDRNWLRQARLDLYLGRGDRVEDTMRRSHDDGFWIQLLGPSPSPAAFALVPGDKVEFYLGLLGDYALGLHAPAPEVVLCSTLKSIAPYRVALHALRGGIVSAQTELDALDPDLDKSGNTYAAMALLDLAKNDSVSAKAHGSLALAISRGKKKYPSISGPLSSWAALCALAGSAEQRTNAELLLANPKRRNGPTQASDSVLLGFLSWVHGGSDKPLSKSVGGLWRMQDSYLATLFHWILVSWNVKEDDDGDRTELANQLKKHGYYWLHAELLLLSGPREHAGTLATMFAPKPAWERKLDTLAVFVSTTKRTAKLAPKAEAEHRIVWLLSSDYDNYELSALLQKRGKSGFSKGRGVSASELRKRRDKPWIGEQDRAIIDAIEAVPAYRGSGVLYRFGLECFAALVDHPLVYWNDGREPAEVVLEKPTLHVVRKSDGIFVSPIPWAHKPGLVATAEGSRLLLYEVDTQHNELCEAIGAPCIELPFEAEGRLSDLMGNFPKSIPLHTDIAPQGGALREEPTDSRLVLQLRRDSDVLRISCFVRPLGELGALCKPGLGNEVLVSDIGGQSTQTRRNLSEERAQDKALLEGCPSLEQAEIRHGDYTISGLAMTLAVLHELHKMGDRIVCLWKEGEPMRVDLSADMSGLQLRFGDTNAWLTADVRVEVSDEVTLRAHELVSKMVPGTSRFVQLNDGQFLALSETLSAKLEDLSGLGRVGKKGFTMGPANAYALSAWLGDIDSKSAKKGATLANKRLTKVRESGSLVASVPKTFKAELRSYQLEAYQWLSRLAHWGGGALLCDDMGLGKTVQMLAVLAERGTKGPALVVAPVSVGPHWVNLMRQFAPTLRAQQLETTGREETVAELGPRDVLIVSYGLLHSECELLTKRSFSTIVLDEAQAIKNPKSRRARAAFKLQGEFRVVTTGTPIENNLGELWSIMNFANPGLLGSSRQFSEDFGKPIQKDGNRDASARLRKLLSPFLLRRTKSQVLTELPAKTEITLEIEPGSEEAEFYSAVRETILAEIQVGLNRPAQQRMQILASLMKLRRIACHPLLGDSNASCGSAKQDAFLELVDELREAGHRILVFSQFVGHLAIAKANLDAKNISYQYLDGSTTKAKRKKAVDAFQNGEGDVFLISLKAGGVGLHLTGADYVIHLDPWWNPAVEDQASDRAHRMGQTRPVTVYRLVTKGTVEQRVLELHARKRQLAEDLISGNEHAGSLGVDELIHLMADVRDTGERPTRPLHPRE